MMDVVYLCRAGENEELRYSLRSVAANLPHRTVHIFGAWPDWVTGARCHEIRQDFESRWHTTTAALRQACKAKSVSDPFVLMNDDFFILDALDEVPTLHLGPIGEVVVGYEQRGNRNSRYFRDMNATRQMLLDIGFPRPLSYDGHTPLVVHKATMLDALNLCEAAGLNGAHKRTVYGNMAFRGGLRIDDVKVYDARCSLPSGSLLSSDEQHFSRVADRLHRAFPEPCAFEGDAPTPTLTAVITNHDYARYLPRCIDSALRYCDEVLVYDDGSTDDSLEVLARYGDRIRVTHRDDASGDPVWGSDLGMREATSTHLIFLDADNYLTAAPPRLSFDYVFAPIDVVDDAEKPLKRWDFEDWPTDADECWRRFCRFASEDKKPLMPFPWGGVWRTSFLSGKRWRRFETTGYAADCRTALDWCKARPTIESSGTAFLAFRKHAGQWSVSPERGTMLSEARRVAVSESMPGEVSPDSVLRYPIRIAHDCLLDGKTITQGSRVDRETALRLKAAGQLGDPRIV